VREQLEHDRVIRLLQAKYKRKFDVAINPGNEQTTPVGSGTSAWYPDLVLQNADRGHKLAGVVEVETAESVNNLEAMSQWATFARLRVPFHLYLPTGSVDSARRFCSDLSIPVAEMWAYQAVGDQLRFTLVQRAPGIEIKEPKEPKTRPEPASRRVVAPARRTAAPRPAAARPNGAGASRPSRPVARAAATRRAGAPSKSSASRSAPARRTARQKSRSSGTGKASKRR
jgi:hypothetical protein